MPAGPWACVPRAYANFGAPCNSSGPDLISSRSPERSIVSEMPSGPITHRFVSPASHGIVFDSTFCSDGSGAKKRHITPPLLSLSISKSRGEVTGPLEPADISKFPSHRPIAHSHAESKWASPIAPAAGCWAEDGDASIASAAAPSAVAATIEVRSAILHSPFFWSMCRSLAKAWRCVGGTSPAEHNPASPRWLAWPDPSSREMWVALLGQPQSGCSRVMHRAVLGLAQARSLWDG
jgi:hypothetical protein